MPAALPSKEKIANLYPMTSLCIFLTITITLTIAITITLTIHLPSDANLSELSTKCPVYFKVNIPSWPEVTGQEEVSLTDFFYPDHKVIQNVMELVEFWTPDKIKQRHAILGRLSIVNGWIVLGYEKHEVPYQQTTTELRRELIHV